MLLVAACAPVCVAMLGTSADLGHAYIVRSELQSFADASAIAAAFELDGTAAGLARADTAARNNANPYDFGTKTVSTVATSYGNVLGTYQAAGAAPSDSRFVQVTATGGISLFFLPIVPGIPAAMSLKATAVAGQATQSSIGDGMAPFAPDAIDASSPTFGYIKGSLYTVLWQGDSYVSYRPINQCPGNAAAGYVASADSSDRGYVNVGQGNTAAAAYDVIVNNKFYNRFPFKVGDILNWQSPINVRASFLARFRQDTDTTSPSFSTYNGNGRRIMTAAVTEPTNSGRIVGFAAFFMPPNLCGPDGRYPCCAEYIGGSVWGSPRSAAAGGAGMFAVKLFN